MHELMFLCVNYIHEGAKKGGVDRIDFSSIV